jgi:hypothetical protein
VIGQVMGESITMGIIGGIVGVGLGVAGYTRAQDAAQARPT